MNNEYREKLSQLKMQYESFDGYRLLSTRNAKIWILFWDITSVFIGLICGYKTFIFSGNLIPSFGYFPVGIVLGLITFKLSSAIAHLLELFISWIVYKLFKTRVSNNLPF